MRFARKVHLTGIREKAGTFSPDSPDISALDLRIKRRPGQLRYQEMADTARHGFSSFPRRRESRSEAPNWIPACAGMTV